MSSHRIHYSVCVGGVLREIEGKNIVEKPEISYGEPTPTLKKPKNLEQVGETKFTCLTEEKNKRITRKLYSVVSQ